MTLTPATSRSGSFSLAAEGEAALTGAVTLSEGSGVTLAQVGQDIEIAASAEPGAWSTYVPALTASITDPTLGAGSTQSGRYLQLGSLVYAAVRIIFGSSGVNAGSGTYRVGIPVAMDATADAMGTLWGSGVLFDAGTTRTVCVPRGAALSTSVLMQATGTVISVSNAVPWTWAANDEIQLFLVYEAA